MSRTFCFEGTPSRKLYAKYPTKREKEKVILKNAFG